MPAKKRKSASNTERRFITLRLTDKEFRLLWHMVMECRMTSKNFGCQISSKLMDKLNEAWDVASEAEVEVLLNFLAKVPDDKEMAIQAMNRDKFLKEQIELRPYLKREVN